MELPAPYRQKPSAFLGYLLVFAAVAVVMAILFGWYSLIQSQKAWEAREAQLTNLSPEERKNFDSFEHILRHTMEPGDVMVIQSRRDGQIFTRTLQSRGENGDLTFLESSTGIDVLVVHSPGDTVSLLQIFGQLISIKIERNFHAPETTTKPSPPSAGRALLFFYILQNKTVL